VAAGLECSSIAFPAISTGIYGFPLDRAAPVAIGATAAALEELGSFERVTFVLFGREALQAFQTALANHDASLPSEGTRSRAENTAR
jgi:O-acetyl-ADP-ribose deacetylase (regulator of RNase III)